jgi:hypothetical protein
MKTKAKKPILSIIALLSFLIMAAGVAADNPGVTVVSGGALFVTLIVAFNRFIGDCEKSIIDDNL